MEERSFSRALRGSKGFPTSVVPATGVSCIRDVHILILRHHILILPRIQNSVRMHTSRQCELRSLIIIMQQSLIIMQQK